MTGFINFEASLGSKWLGLLHDVAPRVSRVALMFNPNTAPFARYYLATFRSAASALAVEPIEVPVYGAAEIESVVTMLGRNPGAGLMIMSDTTMVVHRELICSLADRYRLPTVYPYRFYIIIGGLCLMGSIWPMNFGARPRMSTAYCGARSRMNFQFSYRRSSS
jgi:putative tryptophan/tyrosine transport system substrate-binding protein